MALDTKEGFDFIKKKAKATQKYKDANEDIENLKKKKGESLEIYKNEAAEQLSNLKKKVDGFQKKVENAKSQFDQLLDLTKILSGDNNTNGDSKTAKYLKKVFVTSLQEIIPKIPEILNRLGTKAIGCSEDQTYASNQSVYIKLESIDFLGVLKEDPTSFVGKISYERSNVSFNTYPFSMNKELYNRTQNINQPYSVLALSDYQGKSTQGLFDITYVESYFDPINNQTITGNFFKVDLKPRQNTLITEYLKDYYSTINPVDFKNIFAQLLNQLTGAVSIEKGDGNVKLIDLNKVLLVIKRLLGLCFDSNKEIDVSGNAKVSEIDNIDDSYFEFDEIDLRIIDQKVSDIKLGVVEFEDCETVKLPVNTLSILDAINNLNFIEGSNNNNQINDASNITDVVTNAFFPLKINIDLNFLKEFPKALAMAILSPKVILPIMILAKSIGKTFVDEINSFMDFAKKLKTYFADFVTEIGSLFVRILFDIIKKDLKNLIRSLVNNVIKEKLKKRTDMILSLTSLIMQIANIIKDFRECKSIIDQLIALLSNIQSRTGSIPLPLLMASKMRKGYSKANAFVRVIQEFEEIGIPTGPMPDGSPNLFLAAAKSIINGIDDEMAENARADIAIPALSITPAFQTIPNIAYGVVV
jgi:hypothetical protein